MKNLFNFSTKHVGLIKFNSAINAKSVEKFRKSFQKLEKNAKKLEAVCFVINSPGGSAVQSNIIANNLRCFCDSYNLKLFTFAEDIAASGGYWLLCIGDEVYSYNSSLVGSIGVVWTTIDAKNFLEKRKIERHNFSSKKDKNAPDMNRILDMFSTKTERDVECINKILEETHINFKDHVLKYRRDKLTTDIEKLDRILNADVFVGSEAKELGLVDDIGDYRSVMNEKYKNIKLKNYTDESESLIADAILNRSSKICLVTSIIIFQNFKL